MPVPIAPGARMPAARPGGPPRRRAAAFLAGALGILAPSAALAIDATDGDGAPGPRASAAHADVVAWPDAADSRTAIERLRLDLRPGGGLELSVTPGAALAGGDAAFTGPRHPGTAAVAGRGAVPFAMPDWLRLSGGLAPSGLGLELGAAGLKTPAWHGPGGAWRLGLDTRLAAALAFEEPLAARSLDAGYDLALPVTAAYGPLSLRTTLLEAGWRSDEGDDAGLRVEWPPDTVGVGYRFPDPLAYLEAGEALTLRTEAGAAFGAESVPLSLHSRLAWQPPPGDEAVGFRPRLELDLSAENRTPWWADVGLSARLEFGRRELLPGRHLELALEYTNEGLLRRFYDRGRQPGDQLATVRLGL